MRWRRGCWWRIRWAWRRGRARHWGGGGCWRCTCRCCSCGGSFGWEDLFRTELICCILCISKLLRKSLCGILHIHQLQAKWQIHQTNRVDNTDHTVQTCIWCRAVVEDWVCVVNEEMEDWWLPLGQWNVHSWQGYIHAVRDKLHWLKSRPKPNQTWPTELIRNTWLWSKSSSSDRMVLRIKAIL